MFSYQFAKRRKQIWASPLTAHFLPDGPTVNILVAKMEHTGRPQPNDHLKYVLLTATDCSLLQYTHAACSDGRNFKITGTQTIKEECFNMTTVDLV